MARTLLAVIPLTIDGVTPADAVIPDSVNGNDFPNNGKQFLSVENNSDDTALVLTLQTYPKGTTPGGLTVSDKVINMPFGTKKLIGPFPPSLYNDATNRVQFNCNVSADIVVKVLQLTADPS